MVCNNQSGVAGAYKLVIEPSNDTTEAIVKQGCVNGAELSSAQVPVIDSSADRSEQSQHHLERTSSCKELSGPSKGTGKTSSS